MRPCPQKGLPIQYPSSYSSSAVARSLRCSPMLPIGFPLSFKQTAYVSDADKTVLIISRLLSTLVCGGQPAAGPTSGSLAYLYNSPASSSNQGRRMSRSVSRIVAIILRLPNRFQNCTKLRSCAIHQNAHAVDLCRKESNTKR